MTSDLPAGDVIVLHDDNGRHAYHALTLAMVALDALSTDQSSRALGCAQGARCGCPKAAASSLEQIVSTKAPFFTHPKDMGEATDMRGRPEGMTACYVRTWSLPPAEMGYTPSRRRRPLLPRAFVEKTIAGGLR